MGDTMLDLIVNGLNEQQKLAVTAPANGRLQIIAGPGTGKTKVLVARVAFLLLVEEVSPQHIIVTTFTKKAANEMIERLIQILKCTDIEVHKLLIGTFHSICFRIIKIYGQRLGVSNYSIADESDSNEILNEVLVKLSPQDLHYLSHVTGYETKYLKSSKINKTTNGFDAKNVKSQISKLKAKGITNQEYDKDPKKNKALSLLYNLYQTKLQNNLLLDYDDCLLTGYAVVCQHSVLNFVEHVLVDEFQDTNEIQLQLMFALARGHPTDAKLQNNVTIVGDPDQSIYGFRDAQTVNFQKMLQYYDEKPIEKCTVIDLNENYRSTSDILDFSEFIMRQQRTRKVKNLKSQLDTTFKPVHIKTSSNKTEARWIAYQVEHLLALPNSLFKYSDIAVLVRAGFQTRAIETEFMRRDIPFEMVRGKAFWDRLEVKAIMNHLRVVSNPHDRLACLRTLQFPKKGFGAKTIEKIDYEIELQLGSKNGDIHQFLNDLLHGSLPSKFQLTRVPKTSLESYLSLIEESKNLLKQFEMNPLEVSHLDSLFELIYTKSGLAEEFKEDNERHLNVLEVKRQLLDYRAPPEEDLPNYIDGVEHNEFQEDSTNHIHKFIQSVGLYDNDNSKNKDDDEKKFKKGRVALSTIHGAKGLEWPVVFVPGVSEGLLPAKYAVENNSNPEKAIDEERRCFYVATSRAKLLLYISSYVETESRWGSEPISEISRFLSGIDKNSVHLKTTDIFKSLEKIEKLYQFMNKKLSELDKANLPLFDKQYRTRLYDYMFMEYLNKHNFLIEFNSTVENHVSDASTSFISAFDINRKRSVTTARRDEKIKKPYQSLLISHSSKCSNSKDDILTKLARDTSPPPCDCDLDLGRDRPKKSQDAAKINKAPPYVPLRKTPLPSTKSNTTTLNNKAPVSTNKAPPYIPVKKAPPYIPVRKAPAYTPRTKNKKDEVI